MRPPPQAIRTSSAPRAFRWSSSPPTRRWRCVRTAGCHASRRARLSAVGERRRRAALAAGHARRPAGCGPGARTRRAAVGARTARRQTRAVAVRARRRRRREHPHGRHTPRAWPGVRADRRLPPTTPALAASRADRRMARRRRTGRASRPEAIGPSWRGDAPRIRRRRRQPAGVVADARDAAADRAGDPPAWARRAPHPFRSRRDHGAGPLPSARSTVAVAIARLVLAHATAGTSVLGTDAQTRDEHRSRG